MGLFDAKTPTPVELKGTTTQNAPQYLTDYLTQLAQTGQQQLGQTGGQLIAGLPQNLQSLYSGAQGALNRYQTPMNEALGSLRGAAEGVSGADISRFYDPYQQDVVNELSRQSALNTQRNLLPSLKTAFVGSGGLGGQRYANATGQALSDVEANLLGQQAKLRSEGYKSAMDAALRDRGYDIQAGQSLGALGAQESQAATSGLKTLGDIGTQELGYEQSKIEAPLTRAQNVAQILRGYTYPTTTTTAQEALPGAYAPSTLQQIAGLGSLIGAANKGNAGSEISKFLRGLGWNGSTGDLRGGSNLVTGGWTLSDDSSGPAAYDDSNPFPII